MKRRRSLFAALAAAVFGVPASASEPPRHQTPTDLRGLPPTRQPDGGAPRTQARAPVLSEQERLREAAAIDAAADIVERDNARARGPERMSRKMVRKLRRYADAKRHPQFFEAA